MDDISGRNGWANGAGQKAILVALGVVVALGVLGASFAHETSVQILGFCSLVTVALLGMLQQRGSAARAEQQMDRVETRAVTTASNVEKVKDVLATKTDTFDHKLDAIHVLVNNSMSVVLKDRAADRALIASLRGTDEDKQAALAARQASDAHEAKQAEVDAVKAAVATGVIKSGDNVTITSKE
jgi:hypothetical protein